MFEAKVTEKKTEIKLQGTSENMAVDLLNFLLAFHGMLDKKMKKEEVAMFMDLVIAFYLKEREAL